MKETDGSGHRKTKERRWSSTSEAPNLIYQIIPGNSLWARFKRNLKSMFLVSPGNPRTHDYFRSKEAIQREINRHLTMHFYMIHPFSTFRVYWEIFTLMVGACAMFVVPVIPPFSKTFPEAILIIGRIPCYFLMLDVIANFLTGICKTGTKEVILSFKLVAMSYVKGILLFDILGSLPLLGILTTILNIKLQELDSGHPLFLVWLFRMLSLIRIQRYYRNLVKVFDLSFMKERLIKMVVLVVWAAHFVACLQLFILDWNEKSTGSLMPPNSWLGSLNARKVGNWGVYFRSLHRVSALLAMVCIDPKFIQESESEKTLSFLLVLGGQLLFFFLVANAMHLIRMNRVSSAKYEESSAHLQQYLTEKKIPTQLKKRVQAYYDFKYHKSYFNENEIMETISETLRKDILVFKCKKLLDNAQFFSTLPAELKTTIVICMKNKVYQPDDIIIKSNDSDNCMYFIKTGTVAVFSPLGKEICHLEDGNHFGEISLILSGVKRVSTVIAIENCELYRLEREDFLNAMDVYPEILSSMKEIAEQRMNSTRKMETGNSTRDDG